jgi:hypothetical protein
VDAPVGPPRVPELAELETLVVHGRTLAGLGFEARVVARIAVREQSLPVWAVSLGNPDRRCPAVGFFGGVHGLERIGAGVVLAWMQHLLARASWDSALRSLLERVRMLAMPVVNPGGLLLGTRANPDGVDLMRNAPVDADARVPWLIGGQRHASWLPWYRGPRDAPMAGEAQALCAFVEAECAGRPLAMAIDCHSGFGMRDRIWFPHACTRTPTRVLPELHALTALYEGCQPHHPYRFEPQSAQYLAHGDLWDHLHRRLDAPTHPFLPMTLEMGSWLWVRKNLRQIVHRDGLFNPADGHRHHRVLRRHQPWFDFLLHAAASHAEWLPVSERRTVHASAAFARWYPAVHG